MASQLVTSQLETIKFLLIADRPVRNHIIKAGRKDLILALCEILYQSAQLVKKYPKVFRKTQTLKSRKNFLLNHWDEILSYLKRSVENV